MQKEVRDLVLTGKIIQHLATMCIKSKKPSWRFTIINLKNCGTAEACNSFRGVLGVSLTSPLLAWFKGNSSTWKCSYIHSLTFAFQQSCCRVAWGVLLSLGY